MSARIDLPVSGMTCAACARTIERKLSRTPGVERAQVNLATATATVEYQPASAGVSDFIGAIEGLGYGVPKTPVEPDDAGTAYRRRFRIAAPFAAALMVLGMLERAPWLQFALSLPVVVYAGGPF